MQPTLLTALLLLIAPLVLHAQSFGDGHYPTVLYSGPNVVTVRNSLGIDRIEVATSTTDIIVDGEGSVGCARSHDLQITRTSTAATSLLRLRIVDCRGGRYEITLAGNNNWDLDLVNFGRVLPGTRRCMMFNIRTDNPNEILDSVSVTDERVSIRFFSDLPQRILPGIPYRYEVCFQADAPGVYRFPVVTWMRRSQPSGGHRSYPVADTGVVVVTIPPEPAAIPAADPTTFRTVAVPNAVIPPRGTAFVGVYDLLGVVAGYSVTDNIMLLGGGAIPLPDDWGGVRGQMFGAASIGAKAGLALGERWDVAVGYQFARSIYDEEITPDETESAITLHAPWGAISYGDDDSRASLTLGYAFKHHVKPLIEFDENALIVAAGGDYRFANNWKVAIEAAYMETLGVLPLVATARYFSDTYAIDAGIGFAGLTIGDASPPSVPVLPVISAVFVF
jgi:hypothetical protein